MISIGFITVLNTEVLVRMELGPILEKNHRFILGGFGLAMGNNLDDFNWVHHRPEHGSACQDGIGANPGVKSLGYDLGYSLDYVMAIPGVQIFVKGLTKASLHVIKLMNKRPNKGQ